MSEPITSFRGAYGFLSNFYQQSLVYGGITYPTAEHAYQAAKSLSSLGKVKILQAPSPGAAKRLGNKLPIRSDWEEIKVDVMKNVLRAKFTLFMPLGTMRNPLSIRLLQTGNRELIEGNSWGDTFWGQCPLGHGENMLGKLLMKVRHEISHGR